LAQPENILLLRHVFTNLEALKPGTTQVAITEEVAGRFARLAGGMDSRGIPPHEAAHFLMELMFCMFGEGIDLLPRGQFPRAVANARGEPACLSWSLKSLFESMARRESFGPEDSLHFNGGLFAGSDRRARALQEAPASGEQGGRSQAVWKTSGRATAWPSSPGPGGGTRPGGRHPCRGGLGGLRRNGSCVNFG
jgi:hypothetical protein